jgi:two-component system chemotaxis response regulator CheB
MEKDAVISDCKVLIIGGSAGSLEVLLQIIPKLKTLPNFSLVIVLHRKGNDDTTLEELFALKTAIPVKEVEDKTPLIPGNIYIAPADYHLLFEKTGTLSLDISEKVNYSRPSIDVSFESVAEAYGKSVIAILLSGANADGTQGLIVIKEAGGKVIVQDPQSAGMPFMPQNALENAEIDATLDVKELFDFISSINR